MKIRYDFVTNSSSTSFVIISDGEFNFKDFIEAIGIKNDSDFIDIYQSLFQAFKDDMEPAREYYSKHYLTSNPTFEGFILNHFSENSADLLSKILDAERKGKSVYIGRLRSDNDDIEGFFCTDEFIIESENLYIDAQEHNW